MPTARAHRSTICKGIGGRTQWLTGAGLAILIAAMALPAAAAGAAGAAGAIGKGHSATARRTTSAFLPHVSADGATGMDLTDAWNLTKGDPSVLIAYIEGGINWNAGGAEGLVPNIYVNWHELPVPCSGSSVATATMVVSGVTEPCATVYTSNPSDYDTNHDGVINALDWTGDPRVNPNDDGTGFLNPEDLIAAFSQPPYQAHADGGAYPYDISGWDFYDNQNDPATTDSAYGHANGQMGVIQHECPQCMILPIKAGEEALDATDRLAEAWLFAAEQGARVIVSVTADLGYSTFMAQTIAYLHSQGVIMVEASNDFDSPDHQGGMFWPNVIPGNGAVATSDGSAWTRSDLTSWGTKAMFTVATGGGSTSESTPTTGGVLGLLLSYGDLAFRQGLITSPLDGPEAVQVMRATATPITDPNLPWPGSPGEWNPQYGYGMPQVYDAMEAVKAGDVPPAPSISSPDWYQPVDPSTTSSIPVTGTIDSPSGEAYTWQVQYGLGGNPSTWTTFGSGQGSGAWSGTFGTFDTSQIPRSFWNAPFTLSTTKEVETVDQYTVTFRVVVTGSSGQVGEDRRAIAAFHDPTLLPGFPLHIGPSGESQPALVDLQGTGTLDIVFATADGSIDAIDPSTGQELPGWPAHTDPLSVLGSYPGVNPGDEPVIAPVAVGDLMHTGHLDVVATSVDGKVYAFDDHGNLLPGWPQTLDDGVTPPAIPRPADPYTRFPVVGDTAAPVLAHLSGTADLQIVQAAMDGHIHAYNPDGTAVPGWPVQVALPAGFTPDSGYTLIDDQTLPTAPTIAYLQNPGVPDVVERSQYTETHGTGGIDFGAQAFVFAFQPDGQPVPGWPSKIGGFAEYYGSAQGPITEGTDDPIAGPVLSGPSSRGTTDQVIVNPLWTPASLLGANGQVLATYAPPGGTVIPFVSTGALGMFGNQFTFAQSGVDEASMIQAELHANSGNPITKEEAAFPADGGAGGSAAGGGATFSAGFPTGMQGLDFLGGPMMADVTGNGQSSIVEGGDSSAVQAFQPGGSQAPGFPKFTSGWVIGSPSAGDLFSNGSTDLVATTREGYLFGWSTPGKATADDQWWRWRHDEWNSGNSSIDARPPGVPRQVHWSPGDTSLSFTAPGDDWYSGTVARYDLALAPSGQILDVAPSGPAGSTESVTLPSGVTGVTVQAVDKAGNLGAPATVGATPPAPAAGYLTVTAQGHVNAFGTGTSYGDPSSQGLALRRPVVGMAAVPATPGAGSAGQADDKGYWLVAADGGVFTYGDAGFFGSGASSSSGNAFSAMAATPDGDGYWLLATDGTVEGFGSAYSFAGTATAGGAPSSAAALVPTGDANGYWIFTGVGTVGAYGDAGKSGAPTPAPGDTVVGAAG